jgi:hypothetical protein
VNGTFNGLPLENVIAVKITGMTSETSRKYASCSRKTVTQTGAALHFEIARFSESVHP